MSRVKTFGFAVCNALCLLGIGVIPAHANLIINGGFEDPVVVDSSLHYEHRNGSELTGWTLYSTYRGTVQFNSLYDLVSEGNQAVQIEVGGDWISQTFATVVGQSYLLSYDLSAYNGFDNIGVLNVSVGTAFETLTGTAGGYSHQTLSFAADSLATTLKFENAYPTSDWYNYPHLDNVSVTAAVPEPETYALMLTGLGIMGWVVRRKKREHGV